MVFKLSFKDVAFTSFVLPKQIIAIVFKAKIKQGGEEVSLYSLERLMNENCNTYCCYRFNKPTRLRVNGKPQKAKPAWENSSLGFI